MPRGAWLGLGAVGAALLSGVVGSGSIVVPLLAMVLTPKTDLAHANHLHLDIGPYTKCDA